MLRGPRPLAIGLGVTLAALAAPAAAESMLRVAMTASNIPVVNGVPDQAIEGRTFVGYTLYDSLVEWDMANADRAPALKGGLASSWEIDPADHKRWLFRLRRGVKFHDGCEFSSADVVWNYNRVLVESSPQFNARQSAMARSRLANIANVSGIDAHTVAVTTRTIDSLFPYQVTEWFLISRCRMAELKGDESAYEKAPSGTGPYRFSRIVPGERLELVKNDAYWDKARVPRHDRLVLLPMPDGNARAAALLSGQVDFIEAPPPDIIPRLKAAGMTISTNRLASNWCYLFDVVNSPFKDARIRRAANHAVNRADMKLLLDRRATEAHALLPPSSPYFGSPVRYDFDPARATALLKEAGCYPCKVQFVTSSSGSGMMQPLVMNELIQAQLGAVGFQVTIKVVDGNSLFQIFKKGARAYPELSGMNFALSLMDPFSGLVRTISSRQLAPAGGNWGGYGNPQIDALIGQVSATFDPDVQKQLLIRLHESIVADAAQLWVVHDLNPRALSPKASGFVQSQSLYQDLTPIVMRP